MQLADLFCCQARRRLQALHRAVYANDDPAAYKTARRVLDGDFAWLEENIVCTWQQKAERS